MKRGTPMATPGRRYRSNDNMSFIGTIAIFTIVVIVVCGFFWYTSAPCAEVVWISGSADADSEHISSGRKKRGNSDDGKNEKDEQAGAPAGAAPAEDSETVTGRPAGAAPLRGDRFMTMLPSRRMQLISSAEPHLRVPPCERAGYDALRAAVLAAAAAAPPPPQPTGLQTALPFAVFAADMEPRPLRGVVRSDEGPHAAALLAPPAPPAAPAAPGAPAAPAAPAAAAPALAVAASDHCGVCRRMKKDLSDGAHAALLARIVFLGEAEIARLGVTAFPTIYPIRGGAPDASGKVEGYGGVAALQRMIDAGSGGK
jgi:hypothetical protein